ncbi:hypothetical protein J6590_065516 [Homalodisca vitripennis]|nr:hypothetical protein J6590_065516 [Homalodisca vitripennis]
MFQNSHHGIDSETPGEGTGVRKCSLPYSQKICSRIHITELTVKHLASVQVSENAVSSPILSEDMFQNSHHGIDSETSGEWTGVRKCSLPYSQKICSRIHITELTVKHLASEQVSEKAVSSPILSEDMFQNSHHGIDSETSGE